MKRTLILGGGLLALAACIPEPVMQNSQNHGRAETHSVAPPCTEPLGCTPPPVAQCKPDNGCRPPIISTPGTQQPDDRREPPQSSPPTTEYVRDDPTTTVPDVATGEPPVPGGVPHPLVETPTPETAPRCDWVPRCWEPTFGQPPSPQAPGYQNEPWLPVEAAGQSDQGASPGGQP